MVWTKIRRSFAAPRVDFHSPLSTLGTRSPESLAGRGVWAAAPQGTLGLVLGTSADADDALDPEPGPPPNSRPAFPITPRRCPVRQGLAQRLSVREGNLGL